MIIHKQLRSVLLVTVLALGALPGEVGARAPVFTAVVPHWSYSSPFDFVYSVFRPASNNPEPKRAAGIFDSSIKQFFGIQEPAPGYIFDKKSLPVNITNLPVPVVVSNDSLAVTIRNTSLGVQVLNVPLPVGVVNDTLFVNVTNVPLPTVVVNNSFPVTLSNSSVPVNVLDLPLPVGLVNETVFVNITNSPLPTVVVNDSFPVTLSNSSIPVNVLDLPLPVGIVNATLPVNVQNLPLPVGLVNTSVPVTILNDTLKVDVQNTPLSVNVNNQPLAVNVQNTPLQVTFDQPVNVTSDQLASYLAALNASNSAILNSLQTRRFCPTDSNFGTGLSAPCRRLNSTCYCFFNSIKRNSSDAAAYCKAAGFDGLVSLETRAESVLIADMLYLLGTPNLVYLTSGSDKGSEGNYMWTTTGQPVNTAETYWGANEPNGNTNENCLALLFPDGRWVDTSCSTAYSFICELDNVYNAIG